MEMTVQLMSHHIFVYSRLKITRDTEACVFLLLISDKKPIRDQRRSQNAFGTTRERQDTTAVNDAQDLKLRNTAAVL